MYAGQWRQSRPFLRASGPAVTAKDMCTLVKEEARGREKFAELTPPRGFLLSWGQLDGTEGSRQPRWANTTSQAL